MTRTALTAAAALALVGILVAICLAPRPGASFTPTAYAPVATSAFLPINPLVRPIHVDPTPKLRETAQPSPTHAPRVSPPTGGIGTAVGSVRGTATYYPYHPGQAAAGERLRNAIGPNWRGRTVEVQVRGRKPIYVVLTDFESSKIAGRTIDLDESDFATLAGPGWHQRGVLTVTVTW